MKTFLSTIILLTSINSYAELPGAPSDANHPGSKIYNYDFKNEQVLCGDRKVDLFFPISKNFKSEIFPVVIYGHGQAISLDNYRLTLEHLAKKGIVAIFPTYDNGFFDRDWTRMARDYVTLSNCALNILKNKLDVSTSLDQIIFSGHSKGAYVASVASGLSFKENLAIKPRSILLFEAAGLEAETNAAIDPSVALTVVYSDKDTIVKRKISDDIYNTIPSVKKQFIFVKSYPELAANHFWPLTKGSVVGGGGESPFHYYSAWKWLVASAQDLKIGGKQNNPYLYGDQASDKGISNLKDEIIRNW